MATEDEQFVPVMALTDLQDQTLIRVEAGGNDLACFPKKRTRSMHWLTSARTWVAPSPTAR